MADTICFQDISRYYASTNVQANDHVSFSIGSGEIHAICGENGAENDVDENLVRS